MKPKRTNREVYPQALRLACAKRTTVLFEVGPLGCLLRSGLFRGPGFACLVVPSCPVVVSQFRFGVQGSEFRVWGLGFGVWGLGFGGLGFGGLWFRYGTWSFEFTLIQGFVLGVWLPTGPAQNLKGSFGEHGTLPLNGTLKNRIRSMQKPPTRTSNIKSPPISWSSNLANPAKLALSRSETGALFFQAAGGIVKHPWHFRKLHTSQGLGI